MFELFNDKITYKENNEVIGYVLFSKKDDKTISIDKRGMGIGSKMLEYTYNYFSNKNIKIIYECSYSKKWSKK